MGSQPYVRVPHDQGGEPLVGYPAALKAKATYAAIGALGVSSVVTFTDNTTVLEVETAGGNGVVIRWVPSTETAAVSPFGSVISSGLTANFDHAIPNNTVRRFAIPQETIGTVSIVGAGIQAGLYRRVAWSAAGATASIIATEF